MGAMFQNMTYAWTFADASDDTALTGNGMGALSSPKQEHIIASVEPTALSTLTGKTLNVTLTVTDFLGQTMTASTLVLVSSSAVPTVRHKLGNEARFHAFKPLELAIYVTEKCAEAKTGYSYNWELISYTGTNNIAFPTEASVLNNPVLNFKANTFEVASSATFRATAGGVNKGYVEFTVHFVSTKI
jgi:hypothetical protein